MTINAIVLIVATVCVCATVCYCVRMDTKARADAARELTNFVRDVTTKAYTLLQGYVNRH